MHKPTWRFESAAGRSLALTLSITGGDSEVRTHRSFGILFRHMRHLPGSTRLLIWTVVMTVLVVRASDTHLHLCFDGQEPPATVHFADASVHQDEHHEGQDHADEDVDPFVGAFTKSDDGDVDIASFIIASVLLAWMPRARDEPPQPSDLPYATAGPPHHVRPPLRGPPA